MGERRDTATLRGVSRFAILVTLTIVLLIPDAALAHTTQGNATPSNAGSGHPWESNGCTLSPDSVPGLLNFKHACDHHDGCYIGFPRRGIATYWVSRLQCDNWFLADMEASCREQHPDRPYFSNIRNCLDQARNYYNAVRLFGDRYYKRPFPEPGFPVPKPIPLKDPLPQIDAPVIQPIAPIPTPQPQPEPQPQTRGYHIEDYFFGGTWARTDPNNGTWYRQNNRPSNGAYWYPNGLGVGVDCARTAANYVVTWANGHKETWNTWLHVTDGKWYPSAATREIYTNGSQGLAAC